jgi:hypothetical protein
VSQNVYDRPDFAGFHESGPYLLTAARRVGFSLFRPCGPPWAPMFRAIVAQRLQLAPNARPPGSRGPFRVGIGQVNVEGSGADSENKNRTSIEPKVMPGRSTKAHASSSSACNGNAGQGVDA